MDYFNWAAIVAWALLLALFGKATGYKLAEVQQYWSKRSWPRRIADCVQVGGGTAFVAVSVTLLSKSREWGAALLNESSKTAVPLAPPIVVPDYVNAAFIIVALTGFVLTVLFFAAIYQDRIDEDRAYRALVRERKALRKVLAENWTPYVKAADAIRNEWAAAHAAAWKRAKLEMAQFNFEAAGTNPDKAFPPGFMEPPPDLLDGPSMPVTDSPEPTASNGPAIDPKYFN